MNKSLNIWEALFLMMLFMKMTGIGVTPSWFEVFLPLIISTLIAAFYAFNKVFNWTEKIEFEIWKFYTNRKIKKEASKARKEANKK